MSHWPLAELLPHAGDMILIDAIERFDDEQIFTRLTVKPDGLFNLPDGSLPAWVGVELMAQSVAAFAGCHARQKAIRRSWAFSSARANSSATSKPLRPAAS